MSDAPVYRADDRSLLLPFYKRWLIEPTLPFIPAKVHPNTITHSGHLLCLGAAALLIATHPRRGWVFFAAMLLLQAYNWCDNADGAHARRTRQSSATGEFLDHGLDMLNTTYIAMMTIYTLASSHEYTVMLAILIPGAAAMTCWEQTETGVFRMGLLNQIESVAVLSLTMVIAGLYGTDSWHQVHFGPVTLWQALHLWPIATILFGKVRGLQRVASVDRPIAPALAFLAAQAAIAFAGVRGDISLLSAVALATGVNLYFGSRMLSLRLRSERSPVDPMFLVTAAVIGAIPLLKLAGVSLDPSLVIALPAVVVLVLGVSSMRHVRAGFACLQRLEP
ncbi:MAG: hypothetical protein JWM10_3682 [Myxococcaceae bacterium]|nr:hypothetical protein [Myxococcaceae bacterium]